MTNSELPANPLARAAFRIERNSVSFWVQVKPRSSREGLEMASSGELCLRIHAAPTEGQANEACVQFLARHLRLPQTLFPSWPDTGPGASWSASRAARRARLWNSSAGSPAQQRKSPGVQANVDG